MNARRLAPWIAVFLIGLGVAAILIRHHLTTKKRLVPGDSFWQLGYTLNFNAKHSGAKVHVAFPADTTHGRVTPQKTPESEVDIKRTRRGDHETRDMVLVTGRAGAFRITSQFNIQLSPRAGWPQGERLSLAPEVRAACLRGEKGIEIDAPAVVETLNRLRQGPASRIELLEAIFEHCVTDLGLGGHDAPSDAADALKRGYASPLGRVRALVALCRAARMPARIVIGFEIRQGADIHPRLWTEVFAHDRWEPYDPENGFSREMPVNYLPVRRDGLAVAHSTEVSDLRTSFSITRTDPPPEFRAEGRQLTDILDLTRLPWEMQRAFEVILLMPLGALVTSLFRTIIGLRTFGTFTPTLLALAFVYNDWRTGVVIFLIVMFFGLISRNVLDPLKLLLVPRLSVILTLVVMTIVLVISAIDYLGWKAAEAVLLPMVILTNTVERFYLTSEEDSTFFAIQLLSGTVLVALCCYLVLCWHLVGRFLLVYPEAHFITIAVLIFLGRYSGYRLSELIRFRDLVGPRGGDDSGPAAGA